MAVQRTDSVAGWARVPWDRQVCPSQQSVHRIWRVVHPVVESRQKMCVLLKGPLEHVLVLYVRFHRVIGLLASCQVEHLRGRRLHKETRKGPDTVFTKRVRVATSERECKSSRRSNMRKNSTTVGLNQHDTTLHHNAMQPTNQCNDMYRHHCAIISFLTSNGIVLFLQHMLVDSLQGVSA